MLEYPFDSQYILQKKKSIKRDLLDKNRAFQEIKIAILGGSTTHEIKNILELFLLKNGIMPVFYESDYNRFYEEAVYEIDNLKQFGPNLVYVHTTNKNILIYPDIFHSETEVNQLLETEIKRFENIWSALGSLNCAIIQNNFEKNKERPLGNLDGYAFSGRNHFISKLNLALGVCARKINNLYINDIDYLSSYLGLNKWYDDVLWFNAKYALALDCIPELAFNLSKIISSILGKSKKCLVLDLDNTCWGGVIGDDGVNGISIGTETPIGEGFSRFQSYVKYLKSRGVTLAVCSKNEDVTAREGFMHRDSILKLDDFSCFKANWQSKDTNLIAIANELNISTEAIVFVDDNPFERQLIKEQLSDISVPNIGEKVEYFIDHIDRNGYFEAVSLSKEDLQRDHYYETNKARSLTEKTYDSYDDYLESLSMSAEIANFKPIYLDRITQLINKTNQFNLTTKRKNIGEVERISKDENFIDLYGRLSDKFGDNGLVSLMVGRIDGAICHIELFLMSCRVLKRGMEFAMFDEFAKRCQQKSIKKIYGYYTQTPKNKMVSNLYVELGFELKETNGISSVFTLNTDSYIKNSKYIEINNE